MSIASRFARRNPPAVAAAVLAFASAAVTAFWLLGGTLGLDTVGGEIEKQARERSAAALAVLAVTLVAKLAAGGLALALAGSRTAGKRSLYTLGLVGGAGLALYGGVLVIAGALSLAGVGDSSGRDEYALRWHVFFWDLWFFVWGVALALGAVRARRQDSPSVDAADGHHGSSGLAPRGADIVLELQDTDYDAREFVARDAEGRLWSFGTYVPGG